ncbi:hypothetical protein HPB50_024377 [Hyalomma asiaticum]|uniref:Uncharacterized protein n=1 Tax=Hyalomma asiaticum TaxID=266040 RepID=A0ACB7RVM6_HYAAI|nr:hypothetical protein HPB50_024377 [Hyalomma asiaticum]
MDDEPLDEDETLAAMQCPGQKCPQGKTAEKKCCICNIQFVTYAGVMKHTLEAHGLENIFPCKYCGKRFAQRANRLRHEKNVHLCSRKTCPYCARTFSSEEGLRRHLSQWD